MTTTNNFTDKISNEETAALPAIEFKGEIRIIEHERDIVPACKFLMKQAVVGFDTETRPSFRPGISYRVSGDLRSLRQIRHFRDGGFVDLQSIAPEWGIEDKSLRKLSAIVLRQRVSKAQRLSNWEAATLTDKQKLYAATDAWVCTAIYDKLLHTPKIKRPKA